MLHVIITCLEPTTKLSMLFQVLGLRLHLIEILLLDLGPTATQINIKKVQKQENKCIKSVIRCTNDMPKVCKKGRDVIIVKVNLQSTLSLQLLTSMKMM